MSAEVFDHPSYPPTIDALSYATPRNMPTPIEELLAETPNIQHPMERDAAFIYLNEAINQMVALEEVARTPLEWDVYKNLAQRNPLIVCVSEFGEYSTRTKFSNDWQWNHNRFIADSAASLGILFAALRTDAMVPPSASFRTFAGRVPELTQEKITTQKLLTDAQIRWLYLAKTDNDPSIKSIQRQLNAENTLIPQKRVYFATYHFESPKHMLVERLKSPKDVGYTEQPTDIVIVTYPAMAVRMARDLNIDFPESIGVTFAVLPTPTQAYAECAYIELARILKSTLQGTAAEESIAYSAISLPAYTQIPQP